MKKTLQRGNMKARLNLFVCFHCFIFQDRVSLCSPGYSGTHIVDQAGLELIEIHLPLPPDCWDQRCAPPLPSIIAGFVLLNITA